MKIPLRITRPENRAHYGVAQGAIVYLDQDGEYLPICVSSEIYESNSRTPMEAKKAQAVAARTFIAAHALAGNVIDDTANFQAFKWKTLAAIPNSLKACQQTTGQVLVCDGQLITAWYSNSNGGRTKRSDEAWSSYKRWTIAQDDPWDVGGRAKWGEVKASHRVGMSQIGAAYAASIGVNYLDILRFYYANTVVIDDLGRGKPLWEEGGQAEMKTNLTLVAHARQWVGNPYWYGTCCYDCTTSQLASKSKQYPSHYTENRMPRYRQDIKDGKRCADCIGLIKGHLWEKDGRVIYNAATDVSAGGMFDRATVKGFIHTLPEVPGLLLWAPGHIGIYEGDGYAIEARGFAYGVVRTKVSDRNWTHWCACPYVSYEGFEELLRPEPITEPYEALVVTRTSPLNIWTDTRKTRSIKQVEKGDTLVVLGYADTLGWMRVQKDHIAGVADGQYLQKIGAPQPADDEDDPDVLPGSHAPEDVLYTAAVINVKTGLNLRDRPSKNAETLLLMPRGATVEVLGDNIQGGFALVCYGGVYGYCTRSYLLQDEEEMFYDVVLRCVTKDVVTKVLALYPAAEVTEAE